MGEAITNRLYHGDNLSVLREHVSDESVDLITLDPPFNTNASYSASMPFASCSSIKPSSSRW